LRKISGSLLLLLRKSGSRAPAPPQSGCVESFLVGNRATLCFKVLSMPEQAPLRVAVDTGGTFTDCVTLRHGELRVLKLPSTPTIPPKPFSQALRAFTHPIAFLAALWSCVTAPPSAQIPCSNAPGLASPSSHRRIRRHDCHWPPDPQPPLRLVCSRTGLPRASFVAIRRPRARIRRRKNPAAPFRRRSCRSCGKRTRQWSRVGSPFASVCLRKH